MYNPYEPHNKSEDSQNSARGSFNRETGEYHYVRPESGNRYYSDANYAPADSSPYDGITTLLLKSAKNQSQKRKAA